MPACFGTLNLLDPRYERHNKDQHRYTQLHGIHCGARMRFINPIMNPMEMRVAILFIIVPFDLIFPNKRGAQTSKKNVAGL